MYSKKTLIIILLSILLIPTITTASTCSSSSIKIESIEQSSTTGNAEEITEASTNGKKINLDLKLYDPGDSIEYNLKVKNTSNEDFYFDEESLKRNTDYLEYQFIYEDNSNIVKAGKEKTLKLRIEYKSKVPQEQLSNDVYTNTDKMIVKLSERNNNHIINPSTGTKYFITLFTILILILLVIKMKNIKNYMAIIIGLSIIIPISVYAICTYDIEIEAKIQIDGKEANFLLGTEINIKMKQLANPEESDITLNYLDTNITAIKYSETEPSENNKEEQNIVSLSDSPYPIYMWYDNGTIYWWSEDKSPNLNEDSQRLCQMLDNLVDISGFKHFNTSQVKNMISMFWNASSLENIDPLSNWDVSNVTNMAGMFWGPTAITSLKALKNWDTSNVENMFCTFIANRSLTSLEGLEKWDVSKVTDMSGMFRYCEKIENLDPLSNWNTSNVTTTDQMFSINTLLKNIKGIKNWDMSNVENMRAMFQSDKSLTNLNGIENWDVSNVTQFNIMFAGLDSLEDASSINDWNIQKNANFTQMFRNTPFHPEFTKVQGTWNTVGTFIPS